MKAIATSTPTLEALQKLFLQPASSWKTLHRSPSFRDLVIHYALPFYLITFLSVLSYNLITMKSPIQALGKGGAGQLFFWALFTLFLKVTGMAISTGLSHFGIKSREITGQRLLLFALLPTMALSPLYVFGAIGKLIVFTGLLYSLVLIYYGSKHYFKPPEEIKRVLLISIYSFITFFFILFYAGYLAIRYLLY